MGLARMERTNNEAGTTRIMLRSKLESRLEEYVAGDLDAGARAEVEALLARDAKARALHDEIRTAHDALRTLCDRPEPPVSADDALSRIQRALAADVFAGKPTLELQSWSTVFYRRVAVAAVLLCGVSLGLFLHGKLTASPVAGTTPTEDRVPSNEDRRFYVKNDYLRRGSISGLDWINQSNGKLVTFTPTDAVVPLFEQDLSD